VPVNKLRRLCKAILEEDDPETLTRLIAVLTKLLQKDQEAIKARVSQFNRSTELRKGAVDKKKAPGRWGPVRREQSIV
jgi:hypothetical protein